MSFRCWGVNRIVFITPSRNPQGFNHQGVPPLSPAEIIGSSGLARLYTQVDAGKKEYAKALHLVADCARFCDLSAALIASQSPLMVHACLACAEACKACATECDRFDSAEMKSCVKACRDCETTCRAMVKAMGHDHHG